MESTLQYLAHCIKNKGIRVAFGIVGVPVTPLVEHMQRAGIKFYGFRNEQAASYAASVYGYLTGQIALCITVAGPGTVHALPGLTNATYNCWPMLLLSSGPYTSQIFKGGFQEAPQLEAAKIYAKYAVRVETVENFDAHLSQALRAAICGKPGGVYIELAACRRQVIESSTFPDTPPELSLPLAPRSQAHRDDVKKAIDELLAAKRPLLVFGKGAAYSRAEKELESLVESLDLPFLASPMGKGVVSDLHPKCVGAARSLALGKADVVLLVGVRMNWMFQFGEVFSKDAKIIQVDISADSVNLNISSDVILLGDAKEATSQLLEEFNSRKLEANARDLSEWHRLLKDKVDSNFKLLLPKLAPTSPLGYHFVLNIIQQALPSDAILVNEGANTMDMCVREVGHLSYFISGRLDAGTLGTMGVGVGYAIAAAVAFPTRKVVTVQGDSAFGFSAMEIEVACRYKLPITFIVLNNNGIYRGVSELTSADPTVVPATVLTPDIRYDKIIEAFGGVAYYSESADDLKDVVEKAINCASPCVLNIKITPLGPIPAIVQAKH